MERNELIHKMVKYGLHIKEAKEVNQYITREHKCGIQGIISADHAMSDNYLETLPWSHVTRNKIIVETSPIIPFYSRG